MKLNQKIQTYTASLPPVPMKQELAAIATILGRLADHRTAEAFRVKLRGIRDETTRQAESVRAIPPAGHPGEVAEDHSTVAWWSALDGDGRNRALNRLGDGSADSVRAAGAILRANGAVTGLSGTEAVLLRRALLSPSHKATLAILEQQVTAIEELETLLAQVVTTLPAKAA